MAFSQMAYYLFVSIEEYGGDDGLVINTRSEIPLINLDDPIQMFLVSFSSLIFFMWLVYLITKSNFGLILSGIKDLDILNRSGPKKKDTDDEDIKRLLKKMIKQRSESIEIYKKNNRDDLLQIETQEQKILSTYLPKQLSEEETKKICAEIIAATKASSIKDMGRVMGELKKKYSDTVDFSLAGKVLKDLLNK